MKTIGSRLTLLYVCAVAGVVVAIFFLGRYLLEQQIRRNLDGMLAERFAQLHSRLTSDPDLSNLDLSALFPGQTFATVFYINVEDRWNNTAFRTAREKGVPAPAEPAPRYFDTTWTNGIRVRVVEGNRDSLKLQLATPLLPVRLAMEGYSRIGLTVMAVVLVLSLLAGRLLSRAALRPVRLIQRTAARIRADNLSERIPVGTVQDEISALARLLNQTFDRLESSFDQIQRFSAEASHEIKTPLALIRLNVERLLGDPHLSTNSREAVHDAIEEIHRLNKLVEKLLFLSRVQAGEVYLDRQVHDPREFVETFVHDSLALAESRGIAFRIGINQGGAVAFDSSRMRQVLFNLLANALQATPAGGQVVLQSEISDSLWRMTVEDNGVGLAPEKCELIFERFVRIRQPATLPKPGGAGLGLAICRSIVELHHGRIFAEPCLGQPGLKLSVEIPAGAPA